MKPSIPKGTRDFGPLQTARRNYIFDTIREAFGLFGFSQIETPALENLSMLMGKYGEEGDKLLFKVLNSGDFMRGVTPDLLQGNTGTLAAALCDKGLRYDLTVPFARYVVQHRSELQLPFKRFQIQPVWRADRPQKGRYREFYQCDADIVGSDSLLNEVELLSLIDYVFSRLGIRTVIKINNRKILAGLAEIAGAPDKIVDITVAIDKIEKVGRDAVLAELAERGLDENALKVLAPVLEIGGTYAERVALLNEILSDSEIGQKGLDELREVMEGFNAAGHDCEVEFDVSLARGLNYYTGTIIEVKALDTPMGSITGGGRYDNLTGVFGMSGLSGVGISFGADRIYDVLTDLDLFPASINSAPMVMFANLGHEEAARALAVTRQLHRVGISAEVYPDNAKMKKQMNYANAIGVRYVAFIGTDELASGSITVKNMETGEQQTVIESALEQILSGASEI